MIINGSDAEFERVSCRKKITLSRSKYYLAKFFFALYPTPSAAKLRHKSKLKDFLTQK